MRFGHPVGTPCPPSRDGLIVGPGGIRVDDGGDEWCCHSDSALGPDDVAHQRFEAEERSAGRRPAEAGERSRPTEEDLARLRPERDEEGNLVAPKGLRFDLDGLMQPQDPST